MPDRHELEHEHEQSRLLREALLARAQAEAAEVRADDAREEAERERAAAESARERIAFLAQAASEMAGAMDWDDTVRAVVHSGVPAMADWAALTLVDRTGRLRVVAVTEDDPERASLVSEVAGRVTETGELAATGDRVVAPLKTPAGVIGALAFARSDSERPFSHEHVDIVTSLAGRAALHLHNARLYSERSHIARTLQASLRPSALPEIPGADVAAGFLAAGDQNDVGGDFYDVFLSAPDVWTAIMGDVSGKGAEAATLTSLARHTLRTASMLHDEPAANLALLNRALQADSGRTEFCTVLYARMCAADIGFEVRFSNGGHPAPLLLRPDGSVETVDSGRGPLVGAFPDVGFTEATFKLQPGELLLMYTDGVTEVRAEDFALGERELRATLAAHVGAPPQEVVAAVERRAVELQDGAPRDDITLLAIRAHEPNGELR